MPMYEYRCSACGYKFERYSAGKAGAADREVCTQCGKDSVSKVFSTFAANCCSGAGSASAGPAGCGGGRSPFS